MHFFLSFFLPLLLLSIYITFYTLYFVSSCHTLKGHYKFWIAKNSKKKKGTIKERDMSFFFSHFHQ